MGSLGEFGTAARDVDPDLEPDTFTFYGETFTVKPQVSAMPLLKFADVAQRGTQAEELEGMAAMYRLITSCIVDDDVARFEKVADDHDCQADELMEVCGKLYVAIAGRPTQRPSVSADGSSTTSESSKESSSSEGFSDPTRPWLDSPFARRELAADPHAFDDVVPLEVAAAAVRRAQTG